MTLSLTLACFWAILSTAVALVPSKRQHWPQAYVLIALGIPILGYVTYENGPTVGLLAAAAGASILRWPLYYGFRALRRRIRDGKKPGAETRIGRVK